MLIEAMQNAWRFVEDEVLRDRMKEAKGIGTPATCAEIIGGLKCLTLLAPDIVEAIMNGRQPASLQLVDLLRRFPAEWQAQGDGFGLIT